VRARVKLEECRLPGPIYRQCAYPQEVGGLANICRDFLHLFRPHCQATQFSHPDNALRLNLAGPPPHHIVALIAYEMHIGDLSLEHPIKRRTIPLNVDCSYYDKTGKRNAEGISVVQGGCRWHIIQKTGATPSTLNGDNALHVVRVCNTCTILVDQSIICQVGTTDGRAKKVGSRAGLRFVMCLPISATTPLRTIDRRTSKALFSKGVGAMLSFGRTRPLRKITCGACCVANPPIRPLASLRSGSFSRLNLRPCNAQETESLLIA